MDEPKPELFARYDPFEKCSSLYRETFAGSASETLAIRPVWIIGDLFIINDWLRSDLKKTNWHLNQRKVAVMQHYKQILLSANAQAFVVEQNTLPVVQFDLLPGILSSFPSQIEFGQHDYVIHYLYKESFRDPNLFRRALELLIKFIYSYPESGILYIRIIRSDPASNQLLRQIGFSLLDFSNFFGKQLNIYKIDRPIH